MNLAEKIIVALDVSKKDKALRLIKELDLTQTFKIGLELFTAEGPMLLEEIRTLGKKIFLDLKLHDIPNTVAQATRAATRYGIQMTTIHASGGREMMQKAVEAAAEEASKLGIEKPLLLAVTVLTSLKDEDLREIGMGEDLSSQVLRLALLAKTAGMDGLICSAHEIELIRRELGEGFLLVAPGIRPSWAASYDQKRIISPAAAIQKGADYLVIGRPITAAPSPREAFLRILEEL